MSTISEKSTEFTTRRGVDVFDRLLISRGDPSDGVEGLSMKIAVGVPPDTGVSDNRGGNGTFTSDFFLPKRVSFHSRLGAEGERLSPSVSSSRFHHSDWGHSCLHLCEAMRYAFQHTTQLRCWRPSIANHTSFGRSVRWPKGP